MADRFEGHTPGPLHVSREFNVFEIAADDDAAPTVAFVVSKPEQETAAFNAEYFADNVARTNLPDWKTALANAELFAKAPDMLSCLNAVEWASWIGQEGFEDYRCVLCEQTKDEGHKPECPIGKVLTP